jgi:Pentapeptide repeats (9 copies)
MSTRLHLEEDITPSFICDCAESMHNSCKDEWFYKDREDKRYCVLHYPGSEKARDFHLAVKKKLDAGDFNFRGVFFPEQFKFIGIRFSADADFSEATFSGDAGFVGGIQFSEDANFSHTTFNGNVDFRKANFGKSANFFGARFNMAADFTGTVFDGAAVFNEAGFKGKTELSGTKFNRSARFSGANFTGDTSFIGVSFGEGADFTGASFDGAVDFTRAGFSGNADFIRARFCAVATFMTAGFDASARFQEAWFNKEARFNDAKFKADARFSETGFNEVASFVRTSFEAGASFYNTSFCSEAEFYKASFGTEANFYEASFGAHANFKRASFSAGADFSKASFSGNADFLFANLAAYVRFGDKDHNLLGKQAHLNLQHARVVKPEQVSFHTLRLRPNWFVNVNASRFEFVNVEWSKDLKQELEELRPNVNASPHRLLSVAYRRLAVNAEENHRYGEASDFRYGSMDLHRLEWSRSRKAAYGKGLRVLHWLYWMASGYGERVTRAVVVLIALWLVFACIYTRTGFERRTSSNNAQITAPSQEDEIGKPLSFKRALTYSLGVISLQKPEPRPLTNTAHTLVTLETVLGPLQAALLALAIRRRFMR